VSVTSIPFCGFEMCGSVDIIRQYSRYYIKKVCLLSNIKENLGGPSASALNPWLVAAIVMIALQAMPDPWHAALRYEYDALAAGEVWRIFTANFIHLGWAHLVLNIAGFLMIGWLFADDAPIALWFAVLLVSCAASSLGLYWFSAEARWVVGMSGALHGLFVFGALRWIGHGDRAGWGLLLAVSGKLLWEQTSGAMPFSEGVVGGAVVTDAHLWGALGGLGAGLVIGVWRKLRARL